MNCSKLHELRYAKRWAVAFLVIFLVGTCSVAYAFSGDQIPKNSATPMVLALAASFKLK